MRLLGLFLILTLAAHGDSAKVGDHLDLTLADGTTRSGKVSRVDIEGISLLTSGGGCRVLFSEMNPIDQKMYGYDPSRVAAFDAAEQKQKIAAKRALGMALYNEAVANQKKIDDAKEAARWASRQIITGHVMQKCDDGTLVTLDNGDRVVFVKGYIVGDGDQDAHVAPTVMDDGDFSYVTALGFRKTVHQYEFVQDGRDPHVDDSPAPPPPNHFDLNGVPYPTVDPNPRPTGPNQQR